VLPQGRHFASIGSGEVLRQIIPVNTIQESRVQSRGGSRQARGRVALMPAERFPTQGDPRARCSLPLPHSRALCCWRCCAATMIPMAPRLAHTTCVLAAPSAGRGSVKPERALCGLDLLPCEMGSGRCSLQRRRHEPICCAPAEHHCGKALLLTHNAARWPCHGHGTDGERRGCGGGRGGGA